MRAPAPSVIGDARRRQRPRVGLTIPYLRELDPERLPYNGTKPGPGGNRPLLLTPLELLDRLAALLPPPRVHRHCYFGVLAPNTPLRSPRTEPQPRPPRRRRHNFLRPVSAEMKVGYGSTSGIRSLNLASHFQKSRQAALKRPWRQGSSRPEVACRRLLMVSPTNCGAMRGFIF